MSSVLEKREVVTKFMELILDSCLLQNTIYLLEEVISGKTTFKDAVLELQGLVTNDREEPGV